MTKSNNTPIKRTQRDYSLGFKLQVVDAVEKGDMIPIRNNTQSI